jgi:6-phosphogluconolactonase (cycloisomerase 2 family)
MAVRYEIAENGGDMAFVLRLTLSLVASILLFPAAATAAPRAYVGSYTPEPTARAENHGEGIYFTDVNPATGAPSTPRLVARMLSPSWLALSADRKFLYASSEILLHEGRQGGLVTAFAVDTASGDLQQLNVVPSVGASPAYVSVHPSGKFALLANYYGGSFAVIRIRPDGSLGETTDFVQIPPAPEGTAPVPRGPAPGARFVGPPPPGNARGHMIGPDPSGQFVVGNDTGRNQIFVWRLNTTSGKLMQVSRTVAEQSAGPRHFVFSPDGKILYQLYEQNARLAVYDFNNGNLKLKQAPISTVAPGYTGAATTSELLISKDGKYLYSGNRGPDSIAVWSVDAKGLVTRIADVSTEGRTPRSLALDPSGQFLYAMNQRSDTLATFRIDPGTGIPRFTGSTVPVGTPAVMLFLE